MSQAVPASHTSCEFVDDDVIDELIESAKQISSVPFVITKAVYGRNNTEADEPLSTQELLSLYGIMSYLTDRQEMLEAPIQNLIEAEFGVTHISKIRRQDYMKAMSFLFNLRMDEIRSRR